ncbi:MAG: transcription factor [Candidatus Bathyarchaeota archaeon]|nr:MAG: transcription factor [Candidatus Bathyarchaeota archaeon]
MTIPIDEDLLKKVAYIIGGEEAVKVVMTLKDLGEATDDQILANNNIKLNEVRKILFKLYNYSIVQCDRHRDEQTGWFIFRWRLQPDQLIGFVKNQKKRIRKIIETRLNYEKNHDFYYCNNPNCDRITFEEAMELIFRCPNCGQPLKHFDNKKIVSALEERIEILDKDSK